MNLTLDLPPDLWEHLREIAGSEGTDVGTAAVAALRDHLDLRRAQVRRCAEEIASEDAELLARLGE
ncbi:hypothetical protein ACOQFV_18680 [Nocardiopsis changdeensis]|uniref:CopG family transcriptional regulator n=1 Tax=Nocardiopsis changdeensis TaxID=2831969 RepID=A0ABX8BTH8_9ACTN|nr:MULTISPECIES: CopG family transcriptional regulator [Nocardiopsis]QUX23693.1 CopG family transcriptional regulator [Nocardiopsis changdeensis]QYX39637.1 CopG family transcriptional regulator [Nocardiopsis sp. MT53]